MRNQKFLALDKNDLDNIRVAVKGIVDFAIDQSKQRTEKKMDQKLEKVAGRINTEISDIAAYKSPA